MSLIICDTITKRFLVDDVVAQGPLRARTTEAKIFMGRYGTAFCVGSAQQTLFVKTFLNTLDFTLLKNLGEDDCFFLIANGESGQEVRATRRDWLAEGSVWYFDSRGGRELEAPSLHLPLVRDSRLVRYHCIGVEWSFWELYLNLKPLGGLEEFQDDLLIKNFFHGIGYVPVRFVIHDGVTWTPAATFE